METKHENPDQTCNEQVKSYESGYPTPPIPVQKPFMERYHFVFKAIIVSFLTLLLLIPMALIGDIIHERERTARDASYEVHREWSGSQTIQGPILTIPYIETIVSVNDKNEEIAANVSHCINLLPETLEISGELKAKELKRGIYEIVVYNAPLELKGSFVLPEEVEQLSKTSLIKILTDQVMLNIGISDMRGISDQITMNWGDEMLIFNPGIKQCGILESGVSTHVDIQSLNEKKVIEFSVKLDLKGSESLRFAPVGKTTTVALKSDCTTPSFSGAFLPENREIGKDGFTCNWKVMHMNRNYPQVLYGEEWGHSINQSIFQVDMLIPVQHYQKSMRSVKYAILIILLTFVVNFFVELIQKKRIHPFQYLLVGLALCLFYTLLVSISEHTSFSIAYVTAASMTTILLTCYMSGVLKAKKMAFTIGGLLTILYLYIFILIQMETYALLAGSLGLFIILAIIMYFSQRIKWNGGK